MPVPADVLENAMSMDPWVAERRDLNFDVWQMPYLGNGYLGMRVSYSGEGREIEDELWYSASVMVAGLYGDWSRHDRIRMPFAVALPNFLHFEPHVVGLPWRNDPWSDWSDYCQQLDFRTGTCTTRYHVPAKDLQVIQRVYAHRTDRHLVVQELELVSGAQPVEVNAGALNALGQFKNYTQGVELEDVSTVGDDTVVYQCAISHTDQKLVYGERVLIESASTSSASPARHDAEVSRQDQLSGITVHLQLPPHTRRRLVKLTVVTDSRLTPITAMQTMVADKLSSTEWSDIAEYRRRHEIAWQGIWDALPEFEHETLNAYLPAMLYVLFASMGAGTKTPMQICGLSNLRPWMGKPFRWDEDVFVFPGLLPLFPKWTNDLLEGSFHDPFTGDWGHGLDGKSIGTPALPIRLLYQLTGDESIYRRYWPMLVKAMGLLKKRASFNATLQQYELKDVHPADERGPLHADNNIYANSSAWYLANTVVEAAQVLDKPTPVAWQSMADKGFYMPFDEANGRHLEYASWTSEGLTQFYDGHERKQADVELAYLPMRILTDRQTMARDFDYYAPKITPWGAPEMQQGWFAALECELGRPERALGRLVQVTERWIKGPMRIFTEMQENYRGLFTTGAGDVLCGIVWGLLGVRVESDRLCFVPAVGPGALPWIRCRQLFLAGSKWSVSFIWDDDAIAYQITELAGRRVFEGRFTERLELSLTD